MKTTQIMLAGAFAAWLAACGGSSSLPTPVGPTPVTPTPTAPAPVVPAGGNSLSGTWSGTGSDSFSPELVTLTITQSDAAIAGTAEINAVDPGDGTCGSCHKVKSGTLTGTVAGGSLTMSIKFPAGGDVPAPICDAQFNATAVRVDGRITGTYTGSDTCEGTYSNGVIDLTRQ
jgi:hypothetical protein